MAKSADFAGSGHRDPVMDTVETLMPVCKQVPKVTQVWVQKEQATGQIGGCGNRGGQDSGWGGVDWTNCAIEGIVKPTPKIY